MLNEDQRQIVTHGSTAIQAKGDVTVIHTGLTLADAKAVALDVYRMNFLALKGDAEKVAYARAEEITESFLSRLIKENPKGIEKSNDPDFQFALYTLQQQFARNGDKDLGDLLVDLLVDRSKEEERNILQIVLNESLSTAPKLTDRQLATLAIVFLFKYTQNLSVDTHDALGNYFDHFVKPFVSKAEKTQTCYQHLEFSGCGSISLMSTALEKIMGKNYHGHFMKGFDPSEVAQKNISAKLNPLFFIPCLNDSSKLQVNALNQDLLTKAFDSHAVATDDRDKISELFNFGKFDEKEIKDKCIAIRPYMADLFDIWISCPMKQFTLTSVGIAIAHANIKRFTGEFANLKIWIN